MKDDSGHSPFIKINLQHPEPKLIAVAAMALKSGRTLIFPTDTVYGIGLLVKDSTSPDSIFKAKRRDKSKTVPLLVGSQKDLTTYAKNIPGYAKNLAEKHWPGPLTLVVQASPALPPQFLAADGSIALRMPNSQIVLALIAKANAPIATSSANLQAQPPATAVSELEPVLASTAALVIDGGCLANSQPSTIVSCLGAEPVIIREGAIKVRELC